MIRSSRLPIAAAIAAAIAISAPASAQMQTVYAIGNGGTSLVRFPANNPSALTVVGNFSGAASFLDGIDFRPINGQLYGYLDSTDSFYTVNLATAQLTLASVGAATAPTNTFQLGLDFNPSIDRLRVVTDSAQNIVFNPNTGTAAAFTTLAYATGDPNQNTSPSIIDNAYTRNFAGTATSQQYVIDYGTNTLATLANNAGTLVTVGPLGIDTDIYTGFDIFTNAQSVDIAYAILTGLNGAPSFYNINLATGQATLVGALGNAGGTQVYSLAVIPAPSTLALAIPVAVGALRRRRR